MKTYNIKALKELKRFLNIFYTFPSKVLIAVLMIICVWNGNTAVFETFELYYTDKVGLTNVVKQRENYDYRTSEYLDSDIREAVRAVLDYSLIYQREDENESRREYGIYNSKEILVRTMIYVAENFIEDGAYDERLVRNGFIVLKEADKGSANLILDGKYYYQYVNEERIRDAYANHRSMFIETYRRNSDAEYKKVAEYLEKLKDFNFAVANHTTKAIVSNIEALNGKTTDTQIRSHFSGDAENLLIIRNGRNPYYEQGTMAGYLETVRSYASDYDDNFDLYISFGNELDFVPNKSEYEENHREILSRLNGIFKDAVIFASLSLLFMAILFVMAGRREQHGRYYEAVTDKLPNDVLTVLNIIVMPSMITLIYNCVYMAAQTYNIENYWFNISPDFYMLTANIYATIQVIILFAFVCTIKRQFKMGLLMKNTYIYKLIKRLANSEPV